jgi:DNA (cytosine-5)-methyltransferase 3A
MLKVLSLFDWNSGWQQALERLWITDYQYFASEIDKYAISVTQKNFPNTIQVWDIKYLVYDNEKYKPDKLFFGEKTLIDWAWQHKWVHFTTIDLLIGWSPCTWFSRAGKQLNFEDPQSKLFFEYVRILKEVKARYFMLENVKMKKEFSDIITEHLFWITFTEINSSLLSWQNRKRLYWVWERQEDWTYKKVEISQPEDKKIFLKDILEENVDEKYNISNKHTEAMLRCRSSWKLNLPDVEWKCGTITASYFKIPQDWPYIHQLNNPTHSNNRIYWIDWKSPTLNTMQWGNRQPKILEDNTSYMNYPLWSREFQGNWWKSDKSLTLLARDYKDPKVILENNVIATQLWNSKNRWNCMWSDKAYTIRASNPNWVILWWTRIRKLTVTECEKLQTMNPWYTAIWLVNWVEVPISNTQRYKMIW